MNIAVTGASGEIGARLAQRLLQGKTHQVRLISRSLGARLARWGNVDLRSVDMSDKDQLIKSLEGIDAVINCAIDKKSTANEAELVNINRQNFINLVEAAEAAGVSRIIDLSSIAVLPPLATAEVYKKPFEYSQEADWYTQAKIETEKAAREYRKKSNVQIGIVRAGVVYGPYMFWSTQPFTRVMHNTVALPAGDSSCQAIHVDDLCDLMVHMAEMKTALPEMIYGINPEKVSWQDFYEKHGAAANLIEKRTVLLPVDTIRELIRFKGDVLMLPSFKRRVIDAFRSMYSALPDAITKSSFIEKITHKLKAMNYGLIQYDSYIHPPERAAKPVFYPSEFELKLFQSRDLPALSDCVPDAAFSYKINIDEGTKNAAAWWDFSVI